MPPSLCMLSTCRWVQELPHIGAPGQYQGFVIHSHFTQLSIQYLRSDGHDAVSACVQLYMRASDWAAMLRQAAAVGHIMAGFEDIQHFSKQIVIHWLFDI